MIVSMIRFTKKYFILVFIGVLVSCELQDNTSPSPSDTFLKFYGSLGAQRGKSMIYLENTDEIVILGSVDSTGGNAEKDILFIRTDAAGDPLIEVAVDFSDPNEVTGAGGDDTPGALKVLTENTFLFVGTTTREVADASSTYQAIMWAVLSDEFEVMSEGLLEAFDDNSNEFRDLVGNDIILASDGTYMIVGSSTLVEEGDEVFPNVAGEQIFIAKIDPSDGSEVFRRTRGFAGDDEAIFIDEFEPNNFVIIGTSNKEATSEGRNVILLPVNEIVSPNDGTVFSFPINNATDFDDLAKDVFIRANGYIVTGTSSRGTTSFPFFVDLQYSSAGAVTVDRAVEVQLPTNEGDPNSGSLDGEGFGIALGTNGNFVIVGRYPSFGSKNGEILVNQVDQGGTPVPGMQRNYGIESGNDQANDVVALPNGDLLVLSTVDFGSGSTLVGLLKLNSLGNLED